MSEDICIFKRVEKKYIVGTEQYKALIFAIKDKLCKDEHPKNTVCNIYLDTPDFLLIRNSIDAVAYKEKLRIRGYGNLNDSSRVFIEIKKKYKGVVYKRRVAATLGEAEVYIETGIKPVQSQIMNEIDYAMLFYNNPKPAVVLCYEREAYFAKECPSLRITFDSRPRYRADDLQLEHGSAGRAILPENRLIMEIKTDGAMPLWLAKALDDCSILPASFSKYGAAYKDMIALNKVKKLNEYKGELSYASNF